MSTMIETNRRWIADRISRYLWREKTPGNDRRAGLKPRLELLPRSLNLYITRNCNMRCHHCLWLLQDENYFQKDRDVSLEDLESILRTVRSHVKKVGLVADGEPLMHQRFAELVKLTHALGFQKISTVTNGIKLDEYTDLILKYMDTVTVSIDGPTADTYQQMRAAPEKVFRNILANVAHAVEERRKRPDSVTRAINISGVIGKFNLTTIEDMIRLAEELGVDRIRFNNFNPHGDTGGWKPLYRSDPEVTALFRQIVARDDYRVGVTLPPLQDEEVMGGCGILFSTITVNSRGELAPCCQISSDPKWGQMHAPPEPWNSEALVEFRRGFLSAKTRDELPGACRECHRRAAGGLGRIQFDPETRSWSNTEILGSC